MSDVGRAPVKAPEDLRALVVGRVIPRWRDLYDTLDQVDRQGAREIALDLLAETKRIEDQLPMLQAELAKMAALAGATHEQRGAAVGLGKERARRLWPWPATKASLARDAEDIPAQAL